MAEGRIAQLMLPFAELRVLDANSEYLGVPALLLMENAGAAVAEVVEERFGTGRRVAVVCGIGNNAGDGFVAARRLRQNNEVVVALSVPPEQIKTDLARAAFAEVADLARPAAEVDLPSYDIIIDAVFGTGMTGATREPYRTLILRVNASGASVVAVDVPSGMGADVAVRPIITVTFHDVKEGMDGSNSGEIIVRDIGIPHEAELYVGPGEFTFYPIPRPNSHKGENGRVLVIAGGPYTGAPSLAAMAAYRVKVDLVHIATPKASFDAVASYSPNFIVHRTSGDILTRGDLPQLRLLANKVDAVLIGNGLGDSPATYDAIQAFVSVCDKPLVIDADGIGAVAENLSVLTNKTGVITPHAGEFATISRFRLPDSVEERMEPVKDLAMRTGFTILLKGQVDIISDGIRVKLNRTGNPGMSVGETGDVLAGETIALLSKGVHPFDAARLAAFINGYAGDLAYEDLGLSFLATDVIDHVPRVMKTFLDRFL
jgi:ADP-dependent NAD(P)H-hydrate dehydratase / NAD(P)H-hydrate epimerase